MKKLFLVLLSLSFSSLLLQGQEKKTPYGNNPATGHSTPIAYKDEFNPKVESFFRSPYRETKGRTRFNETAM